MRTQLRWARIADQDTDEEAGTLGVTDLRSHTTDKDTDPMMTDTTARTRGLSTIDLLLWHGAPPPQTSPLDVLRRIGLPMLPHTSSMGEGWLHQLLHAAEGEYLAATERESHRLDLASMEYCSELAEAYVTFEHPHDLWQVYTDLGAWQEDVRELLGSGLPQDVHEIARIALFLIAERLFASFAHLPEAA